MYIHIHIYSYTYTYTYLGIWRVECCGCGSRGIACVRVCQGMSYAATRCNTLQYTAAHCNTLQHTAVEGLFVSVCQGLSYTATRYNALQHAATRCNTLQHTATHCNRRQSRACLCQSLPGFVIRCNTLQRTADFNRNIKRVGIRRPHLLCQIRIEWDVFRRQMFHLLC